MACNIVVREEITQLRNGTSSPCCGDMDRKRLGTYRKETSRHVHRHLFTYHCEIPSCEFVFVFTIGSYS